MSTIVSTEMLLPVTCDHCECDTDFSLGVLKQLSRISCGHCGHSRHFTAIEFDVLKLVLANAGFHFRD
ncbi:hypothetical protein [Oceanobacter mangrovi]|uniref:hypothetical protein n=1 Tax=Oceanobacter mangrovi TaxID=2862510 RepID=UPI001C8F0943|nr:hypothetical protein [Oceanobacter mangrovi]